MAAFLFPADPLRSRRVDPHWADEAAVARERGAAVTVLDHDALAAGRARAATARLPYDLGPVWYRGWMTTPAAYRALASALAARGGHLVTAPEAYAAAHQLPGWYPTFAAVTPASVWTPLRPGTVPSAEELAALAAPLGTGPGVVKDYVKSRKHEWAEACHVPDLLDPDGLHRVVTAFVTRQEDDLAGGIVLRAYEPFDGTGEARVWWVRGEPVLVGPHPDTPDRRPDPDLRDVAPLVRALGAPFVTTDLARHADGRWRVVEVGDGQVSDRPREVAADRLIDPLLTAAA